MKDHRASQRYARALFELAEMGGSLDRVQKELDEVSELIEKYHEISNLLMNTTIAREEKEDFLDKILPEKTSSLVVNFIKVLIKKRRFKELPFITEDFHRLYEKKKGIQRVRVESSVSLDDVLQSKLRYALEKKMKCEIVLEPVVNPDILGGLVLDFQGTQIDGSFRTALQELKQKLLQTTS